MSRTYSDFSYSRFYSSATVYRFPYRKSYGFILLAIMLLIMSWETQQMDAAVAHGGIPEEAIRLRILAHSDSPADQQVKRVVRDEVVKAMNGWAADPQTIEEARRTITTRLPELKRIVADVLESRGFAYEFSVKLDRVGFPTKMYGSKVYPAGAYEALLISIGEGKGQNWWCVLFPPLCFLDAATGEASVAASRTERLEAGAGAAITSEGADADASADASANKLSSDRNGGSGEAPIAKFFLWELLQSFIDWLQSLF